MSAPALKQETLNRFTSFRKKNAFFWTAAHLSRSVPRVPQSIPEVFSSTGGRIDHFERNSGNSKGLRGFVLPVRLSDLFPHDHIEAGARLVSEHEACVVVVPVSVHVHSPAEVHGAEFVKACDGTQCTKTAWSVSGLHQMDLKKATNWHEMVDGQQTNALLTHCDAWVRVGSLNQLFALMSDHPVRIDLSGSLGIQVDHLELSEVCSTYRIVLWAHVQNIRDAVIVKVVFAGVSSSIAYTVNTLTPMKVGPYLNQPCILKVASFSQRLETFFFHGIQFESHNTPTSVSLRISSKFSRRKNWMGRKSKTSQDSGFHTFAKSAEENQSSFHVVTASTDTRNCLKSIRARLQARSSKEANN